MTAGRSRCAALLLAASTASAVGCGDAPDYHVDLADPAPPVTRTLEVGTRRVTLTLPAKWRHDDRGATHGFRRSIGSLSVADLGPVTPAGMFDAIIRARDAFLDGHLERAQAILATVDLRRLHSAEGSRHEYEPRWRKIRRAQPGTTFDRDEVVAAYAGLLNWVFYLALPDSAGIFDDALQWIRHDDELREVASRQERTVDGREARLVDTWNRRSHTQRRSHLLILDEGYLLLIQTEFGDFEELKPEFAMLTDSLRLK